MKMSKDVISALIIQSNKTGTFKVGALFKAQKELKTFFEKKLEISDFFLSENVA